jgi:hypothetical protein
VPISSSRVRVGVPSGTPSRRCTGWASSCLSVLSQLHGGLRAGRHGGGSSGSNRLDLQSVREVDLQTGGRAALDEQLTRLRRASDDPALLIGTAKEMLESVAKFVLEENGFPIDARMDFNGLWQLARERLGVLPQQVDQSIPGTSR